MMDVKGRESENETKGRMNKRKRSVRRRKGGNRGGEEEEKQKNEDEGQLQEVN